MKLFQENFIFFWKFWGFNLIFKFFTKIFFFENFELFVFQKSEDVPKSSSIQKSRFPVKGHSRRSSPKLSLREAIIDLLGGKLVSRPHQFFSSPVEVLQGCLRISIWGGWGLAGWRRLLNIVITGTNLHQLGPSPVQGFKGLGWNFPAFRRCLRGCFFLGFHYKNRGFNINDINDRKWLIIDWRLWIKLHETQSINKDYRTNSMEVLILPILKIPRV